MIHKKVGDTPLEKALKEFWSRRTSKSQNGKTRVHLISHSISVPRANSKPPDLFKIYQLCTTTPHEAGLCYSDAVRCWGRDWDSPSRKCCRQALMHTAKVSCCGKERGWHPYVSQITQLWFNGDLVPLLVEWLNDVTKSVMSLKHFNSNARILNYRWLFYYWRASLYIPMYRHNQLQCIGSSCCARCGGSTAAGSPAMWRPACFEWLSSHPFSEPRLVAELSQQMHKPIWIVVDSLEPSWVQSLTQLAPSTLPD